MGFVAARWKPHISELQMLVGCVCANGHGSTNVFKAYMGKMALKMGIKLPWKRRGNMLDCDRGACSLTGVDEGQTSRSWCWSYQPKGDFPRLDLRFSK